MSGHDADRAAPRRGLLALIGAMAAFALAPFRKALANTAQAAPAAPRSISAPEALEKARAGEIVLIDVRTPEEWRQTGVPEHAKLADMRDAGFEQALLAALDGDPARPVALICRSGVRSRAVAEALASRGFAEVYDVSEGMVGSRAGPGWLQRALPLRAAP